MKDFLDLEPKRTKDLLNLKTGIPIKDQIHVGKLVSQRKRLFLREKAISSQELLLAPSRDKLGSVIGSDNISSLVKETNSS